jgi:hypothetical protein
MGFPAMHSSSMYIPLPASLLLQKMLASLCYLHWCYLIYLQVSGAPSDQVGYEGATVLDPETGYYEKPVRSCWNHPSQAGVHQPIESGRRCHTVKRSPHGCDFSTQPCWDVCTSYWLHHGLLLHPLMICLGPAPSPDCSGLYPIGGHPGLCLPVPVHHDGPQPVLLNARAT